MRHVVPFALGLVLAIPTAPLAGQGSTDLGCDSACLGALRRLEPGARVQLWANNELIRGRYVGLVTDSAAATTLLIRSSDDSASMPNRVVVATQLQSISEAVSNAPRYALFGTAVGTELGLAVVGIDVAIAVVKYIGKRRGTVYDERRAIVAVSVGAAAGSIGGAVIGSMSRRWEQRFARPQ